MRVAGPLVLSLAVAGCGFGVGRWQPGRESRSQAGAPGNGSHASAVTKRLPEPLGGDGPMYYFDQSFFGGIKQGVAFGRGTGGEPGGARFFMEIHFDFLQFVLGDALGLGLSLFGAGYGTSDRGPSISYACLGAGPLAKVRLASSLALHAGGGPLFGGLGASGYPGEDPALPDERVGVFGARAVAGLDWVFFELEQADLILTLEGQLVRTREGELGSHDSAFEGGAIAGQFVFAGF